MREIADLLKTVFVNFIDNGTKAVEKAGTICIKSKVTADTCEISITDNGKGIPQSEIAKLTEHFYMVDKSRRYIENSVGLGLTICKTILDAHHASMRIESEEHHGTTVLAKFKLGKEYEDEE